MRGRGKRLWLVGVEQGNLPQPTSATWSGRPVVAAPLSSAAADAGRGRASALVAPLLLGRRLLLLFSPSVGGGIACRAAGGLSEPTAGEGGAPAHGSAPRTGLPPFTSPRYRRSLPRQGPEGDGGGGGAGPARGAPGPQRRAGGRGATTRVAWPAERRRGERRRSGAGVGAGRKGVARRRRSGPPNFPRRPAPPSRLAPALPSKLAVTRAPSDRRRRRGPHRSPSAVNEPRRRHVSPALPKRRRRLRRPPPPTPPKPQPASSTRKERKGGEGRERGREDGAWGALRLIFPPTLRSPLSLTAS